MAATRQDVNRWISTAKENNSKFIISVCDCFDYDDYPVYCENETELIKEYDLHNGRNMQRINEIIVINQDEVIENIRNTENAIKASKSKI